MTSQIKVKTKKGNLFSGLLTEAIKKPLEMIIIHVHGMAESYKKHNMYNAMRKYYPLNNISFLTIQHSGTGSQSAALERFEDCVEDIQAYVNYAVERGYKKIWLQSHSLGTSKVAYYMDKVHPSNINGLVFLSPSEMVGLVHDPIGQLDYDAMYPEAIKLVNEDRQNQILKHKLWYTIELSAGTFINLFGENTNTAIFNYANSKLGWKVINGINVPVLAITGTKDDGIVSVIDANKAMIKLTSELKSSKRVKTIIYNNCEHDFIGFEKNIVKDVVNFINN